LRLPTLILIDSPVADFSVQHGDHVLNFRPRQIHSYRVHFSFLGFWF